MSNSDFDPGNPPEHGYDIGSLMLQNAIGLSLVVPATLFTGFIAVRCGLRFAQSAAQRLTDAGFKFFDEKFVGV